MKRLSTALAATALLALAACGGRSANNAAAIDTTNDVYEVPTDSLTANDLGNASSGNASSSSSNSASSSNSSAGSHGSSGGNSASSHASGNSH